MSSKYTDKGLSLLALLGSCNLASAAEQAEKTAEQANYGIEYILGGIGILCTIKAVKVIWNKWQEPYDNLSRRARRRVFNPKYGVDDTPLG
jgi:hypothetical protein